MIGDQAQKLRDLVESSHKASVKIENAISIVSGKGGTGKTFFAANFAESLAELGKKVLLVDFDFNLANLHLLFNVETKYTITDFLLHKVTFKELIVNIDRNLDLIFGDSGRMNIVLPDDEQTLEVLGWIQSISAGYDYVIFDNSAGISNYLFTILHNSSKILIITNPEITSVLDAYVIFKMMKKNRFDQKTFVVVNKANNEEEGKLTYFNLSRAADNFLKIKPDFLGWIMFNREVEEAIKEQKMFRKHYSQTPAANQIDKIARKFDKINQLANIRQL